MHDRHFCGKFELVPLVMSLLWRKDPTRAHSFRTNLLVAAAPMLAARCLARPVATPAGRALVRRMGGGHVPWPEKSVPIKKMDEFAAKAGHTSAVAAGVGAMLVVGSFVYVFETLLTYSEPTTITNPLWGEAEISYRK